MDRIFPQKTIRAATKHLKDRGFNPFTSFSLDGVRAALHEFVDPNRCLEPEQVAQAATSLLDAVRREV